jgi:hypothetical protein
LTLVLGYLNDQWTFQLNALGGEWTWIGGSQLPEGDNPDRKRQQNDDRPSGRFYASAAYIPQKLFLFGGLTLNSGLNSV